MSEHDWKPGDVAMVAFEDVGYPSVRHADNRGWLTSGRGYVYDHEAESVRPLVVLDPDDREQVQRLIDVMRHHGWTALDDDAPDDMASALRSLVVPPRAEVYEHVAASQVEGITTSLCGKVWRRDVEVTVVGKCPACVDLTEQWVS